MSRHSKKVVVIYGCLLTISVAMDIYIANINYFYVYEPLLWKIKFKRSV